MLPVVAVADAPLTVYQSPEEFKKAEIAATGPALTVTVRYAYEPNFRGLYLNCWVALGTHDAKGELAHDGIKASYHSEHGQALAFGKHPEGDYEKLAPHWGADHG